MSTLHKLWTHFTPILCTLWTFTTGVELSSLELNLPSWQSQKLLWLYSLCVIHVFSSLPVQFLQIKMGTLWLANPGVCFTPFLALACCYLMKSKALHTTPLPSLEFPIKAWLFPYSFQVGWYGALHWLVYYISLFKQFPSTIQIKCS